MQTKVSLTWEYSPAEIFPSPISLMINGNSMSVVNGVASIEVDGDVYDGDTSFREHAFASLKAMLDGVALLYRTPIFISVPQMIRKHPDGHQTHYLEAEPVVIRASVSCEVTITDENGNVTYDSLADRALRKHQEASKKFLEAQRFGELIGRHPHDKLLTKLVDSYKGSIANPNNEFTYLYEIRDALSDFFGGQVDTCKGLGLIKNAWSRFGQLCNNRLLYQSRHRGQDGAGAQSRNATKAELEEVRAFALKMIFAYATHLDNLQKS